MQLVHETSGQPVTEGSKLTSFRGETYWLRGGRAPQHSGSTGKVWVVRAKKDLGNGRVMSHEYYPSVFGLKWVDQ